MNFLKFRGDKCGKNKRSYIWLFDRTDSARNWHLGGECTIAHVFPNRQGWCLHLGDYSPSAAITGSVDDDDPQTALALLGILPGLKEK